jgi:hypothetical protein
MKTPVFYLATLLVIISCQKEEQIFLTANATAAKGKIDICHQAGGKNHEVISISIAAWPSHLNHGDVRLDDEDGDGYVPVNGCEYGKQKIFVGDLFQGGKVGYIFKPGDPGYIPNEQHGLIISLNSIRQAEWGCAGNLMNGADGIALGSGKQNTEDILNGCPTPGIAARLCADFAFTQNNIVYDDWFLGSKEEMRLLVYNRTAIGGFPANDLYTWTSTENSIPDAFGNTRDAWAVNFYFNINEGWKWKSVTSLFVIPIRYF